MNKAATMWLQLNLGVRAIRIVGATAAVDLYTKPRFYNAFLVNLSKLVFNMGTRLGRSSSNACSSFNSFRASSSYSFEASADHTATFILLKSEDS